MKTSYIVTLLISILILIVASIFFLGTLLSYEIPHLSIVLNSFMWIQYSLFMICFIFYKNKTDSLEEKIKHIEDFLKGI